jgi:pimeloyl-ACP methyl ester carboxylesterase
VAAATSAGAQARERKQYVLVHGTGFGGWCWDEVADALRAQGHRVFTPTLTGLGERRHLRSPMLGLETHIQDVENLVRFEDLDRVILVGHSYAGVVITGACDRLRERIRNAVYIDAAAPGNGESNARGRTLAELEKQFGGLDDGYLLRPTEAGMVGMGIGRDHPGFDDAFRRMTPHPLQTWVQPLHLVNGGSVGLRRTYVFCNQAAPGSATRTYAETKRDDPSWTYHEIASGHACMVTHPAETASVLVGVS